MASWLTLSRTTGWDGDKGASLITRPSPVHVHLDDWMLCRIYNKKGVIERYDTVDSGVADVKPAPAAKNPRPGQYQYHAGPAMKVELSDYGFYQQPSPPATEMLCFDRSGSADRDSNHSMPRLHTDSSSSERALSSPSPDFPSDMDYAESQHAAGGWPGDDWGGDGSLIFDPPSPGSFARDAAAFGDMLTYLQKLF